MKEPTILNCELRVLGIPTTFLLETLISRSVSDDLVGHELRKFRVIMKHTGQYQMMSGSAVVLNIITSAIQSQAHLFASVLQLHRMTMISD